MAGAHKRVYCAIQPPEFTRARHTLGVERAAWLQTCLLKVPPAELNARLDDRYGPGWATPFTWIAPQHSSSNNFRFLMVPKGGSESIRTAILPWYREHPLRPLTAADRLRPTAKAGKQRKMTWRDYCSLFGVVFAPEPLGHYLSGYAELAHWQGDGEACDPETGVIPDAAAWPFRSTRHEDEHRAPTMWILRNVAEHFKDSGADQQCGAQMISFLGHMSGKAGHDWSELGTVMASAGLRKIQQGLEHIDFQELDQCKEFMGEYAHKETIPGSLAVPLCEDLLEDYVCLAYNLPRVCRANEELQQRFEAMKARVEYYHGRPAPAFE